MGIVVNTNTQSLFAQRALGKNTMDLQRSVEKLSTGSKINRAADDAAGLSISQKMTAQIKGLDKAKQNVSDGVSLIQTAEGGLSLIQDNLQRIRELVVQAANGTNGNDELDAIQREINERVGTIDDIATETKFNGIQLLKANTAATSNITIQSGADNGQTSSIDFRVGQGTANVGIEIDIDKETNNASDAEHGTLAEGSGENGFALNKLHVGGTVNAQDGVIAAATTTPLTKLDALIDNVSRMRSTLGADQNSLESKLEFLDVAKENMAASRSRIQDVDVAMESSKLVRSQILQQASSAMLSQANNGPQLALNLLP